MDTSCTTERDFVTRVHEAQELLRPYVQLTGFDVVPMRPDTSARTITVVYEGHQDSGSHLIRAAYLGVLDTPSDKTIVCASHGNFGAAVAHAAARMHRNAVIFVPETTPAAKLTAIGRQRPIELRQVRGSIHDAERMAQGFAREHGAHFVSGYQGELALIAAGTLAAEILAEVPAITDVLVPTGGGALVGGIAEYLGERLRVCSVETQGTHSMAEALRRGRRVRTIAGGLAVDSLGVPMVGLDGFQAARRWNVQSVLVTDEAAADAQKELWTMRQLPAELGAAVPLAALRSGRYSLQENAEVAVVVSGSHLSPADLLRLDES